MEILSGRDFNDSGEAKDGAHTTELLKEKEKEKLRLELEILDQSRKRGRGERSGRLWLYGRAAIKKREQQQAGLAWLAGWLAGWLLGCSSYQNRDWSSGARRVGAVTAVGGFRRKGWLASGDARGGSGRGSGNSGDRSRSSREASQRPPPDHGRLFKVFQTPES